MSDLEPLGSDTGDVVDIDVNDKLDVEDISAKRLPAGLDKEKRIDVGRWDQDGSRPESHRLVEAYGPARGPCHSLFLFLAGVRRQLRRLFLDTLLLA